MAETPTLDEFEATVVSLQENQRRFTSARVGENGAAIAKYGVGRARDIKAILKAGTAMIERIAELEAACAKLVEAANCDDDSEWDDLLVEATNMAEAAMKDLREATDD